MSVVEFSSGDLFVVRVIKHHTLNPDRQWTNTYEFRASAAGTESVLLALAGAVSQFEKALALDVVSFSKVVVSTWEPDSKPYDPATFLESGLSFTGDTTPATDAAPLNMCLSIARTPASGRQGHIFFRGNLVEGDFTSPAGKPVLVNRDGKNTDVQEALTSSGLIDYIEDFSSVGMEMVMISSDGLQVRHVLNFNVVGISALPLDHAWFNRTTPAP